MLLALAVQSAQQPALRDAYRDDESRRIVARARRARLMQDSSLRSYDAIGRQRLSVAAAIGAGLQRTAYRVESAFHVRWRDRVGAEVQLTGARVGVPIAPEVEASTLEAAVLNPDITPIPYSLREEPLWPARPTTHGRTDDRLVHPLGAGAEAYYTYESGATTRIRLPNGHEVVLRELEVRPRSAAPNLAVGSLWFDDETGQLVRAGYRLAAPLTLHILSPNSFLDDKKQTPLAALIMKGLISPFKVEISGIAVEYALYDDRYWLPKSRLLQATARVSFARLRVEIEQSFAYPTVNGPETPVQVARGTPDRSLNAPPCDSSGHRRVAKGRADRDLPVTVEYPCDLSALATSPDFTGRLYAPNEAVFDTEVRHVLDAALPFSAQARTELSALPRPDVEYGVSMTRYNRIEGLSSGIHAEQQLGGGYVVGATARIGTADRELNADLSLARTNLNTAITLRGYDRLVAANDWGSPLSFGSSVSALLLGRDEGFYYRASGAELTRTTERERRWTWRLFTERERAARQHTSYALGASFVPNIEAATGLFTGADVRWQHGTGDDPRGLRTMTNVRLEAVTGDSSYGRGAVALSLERPLVGRISGALTLSGGSSVGALTTQRRWYLGGTQTIRGQSADTAESGNAFWMTRAELASEQRGYRVALFSDLGWVGDRSRIATVGRPLSGVGIGVSGFDGLVRLDVARGFYPRKQTRVVFYFGGGF